MDISVFTLTSDLHQEMIPDASKEEFIQGIEAALGCTFRFCGEDFSLYGSPALELIYVRTGGTEGLFRERVAGAGKLSAQRPVYLLTSGKSNSLAASMEIMSYLRDRGFTGEIIHGTTAEICARISSIASGSDKAAEGGAQDWRADVVELDPELCSKLKEKIAGKRLGVLGRPSDWLISSDVDYAAAKEKLGVELIDIPMDEVLELVQSCGCDLASFAGSLAVYDAVKEIVAKYALDGLTIRCFDLLGPICNTGCLALAKLNAEGIPAACEGDVPALLTMVVADALTGVSGFQCNLSRIDRKDGNFLFAHCTVPFNMVTSFRYDTHFESGLGTAVKGELPEGPVTLLKMSADLGSMYCRPAQLVRNTCESGLCRTQVVLNAPGADKYLLTRPFGNHHVVVPGHIILK